LSLAILVFSQEIYFGMACNSLWHEVLKAEVTFGEGSGFRAPPDTKWFIF